MNREEFHLFDATVDLFDSSEINSDSRNSDVKPLVLRVILVVRVYFPREPPSVAAGLVWRQRRRFHLSPGASPQGWITPKTSAEGAIQDAFKAPSAMLRTGVGNDSRLQRWDFLVLPILGRCPRLEMNAAPLALSSHRIRFFCARLRSYDGVDF
jgi:hypothetical protein